MSLTLQKIFELNPTSTIGNADLLYISQSPYTPGSDAGISGSSLKSLFVLSTSIIDAAHGGTGVNNSTNTITLGGNILTANSFTTIGNFAVTQTYTGATNVTFPTSGTLATITGTIANATNVAITDDNSTNTTVYPTWVTTNTGNLPVMTSSTNLNYNPSTGLLRSRNYAAQVTSTVSSGTPILLIASSTRIQLITGTQAQTIQLPAANTLTIGWTFEINNNCNQTVTIQNGTPTVLFTVPSGGYVRVFCISASTTGGAWDWHFLIPSNGSYGSAGMTVSGTLHVTQDLTLDGTNNTVGTITSGSWQGFAITEGFGGTNQSTYALGDILYSSATNTLSKLSGNTTAVKQYLSQTGTGTISAAPSWATISGGDITGSALTKTNDTNVTLTLGGSPTTALLNATSLTLGWTGQLGLTRGGTNASLTASNGGIFYSTASAAAILSGTATANQMLQSGASAAPTWSTSTYPATNAISTLLYASSANVMSALATANAGVLITSSSGVPSILASTTTGSVLQSNVNALGSPSFSTATYPSTATGTGTILRADGTNWTPTTTTYPNTNAINTLLYASSANVISALATANGGLLVTSSTGVPSILAAGTSGAVLQSNSTAPGNPTFSTATYPSVATGTGTILRADGTNWLASTSTFADTYAINTILYNASANTVSGLSTANSGVLVTSSGGVPSISSTLPAVTTSSITFSPTTGGIVGTTTNDNAAAGKVGEVISSVITAANSINLATATDLDLTSINLTAGDWFVYGNVLMKGTGTSCTALYAWLSATSATTPDRSLLNAITISGGSTLGGDTGVIPPSLRFSLSGNTTIYISMRSIQVSGNNSMCGGIYARRVR